MFWDIVIVDEAHYIKNPSSKRSKAVRMLRRHRGFLLTGSPMLNRPDELWALLNFMDPHRFKNRYQFRNRFCVMGGFKMKEIVGVKNKGELRGIMDEYMLRRLKKDCLDLPDKQIIRLKVEMHPEQKKVYDKMETELMLEIPAEPDPLEAENILVKMLRLKQICGTPAVFGLPDDSYKLDRVIEMCQEFTQEDPDDRTPVVVWTQFRGVMDITAKRLARAGIPTWQLHGDVKQEDRMGIIHEWAGVEGDRSARCPADHAPDGHGPQPHGRQQGHLHRQPVRPQDERAGRGPHPPHRRVQHPAGADLLPDHPRFGGGTDRADPPLQAQAVQRVDRDRPQVEGHPAGWPGRPATADRRCGVTFNGSSPYDLSSNDGLLIPAIVYMQLKCKVPDPRAVTSGRHAIISYRPIPYKVDHEPDQIVFTPLTMPEPPWQVVPGFIMDSYVLEAFTADGESLLMWDLSDQESYRPGDTIIPMPCVFRR